MSWARLSSEMMNEQEMYSVWNISRFIKGKKGVKWWRNDKKCLTCARNWKMMKNNDTGT